MNTIFMSKYGDYELVLRSAETEIVQTDKGKKTRRIPSISAKFYNKMFDADKCDIPWDTDEIVQALREDNAFGVDYWQPDRPPIQPDLLVNQSFRDLQNKDYLDEVGRPGVLLDAIELEKEGENRSTIINKFEKTLEDRFGIQLKNDEEDE